MKKIAYSHRVLYTIVHSLRHRKCLKHFLSQEGRLPHVTGISAEQLEGLGIRVLVLDFDGVLSPYAAVSPLPSVQKWLHHLLKSWNKQVFILSNKPFAEREAFMKQEFPRVHFISGVAKKPFPEGLKKIIKIRKIFPQELLMVDDRLLTGLLAACIAGTKGLLITHPVRKIKGGKALHELFFSTLRWMDEVWVRLILFFPHLWLQVRDFVIEFGPSMRHQKGQNYENRTSEGNQKS